MVQNQSSGNCSSCGGNVSVTYQKFVNNPNRIVKKAECDQCHGRVYTPMYMAASSNDVVAETLRGLEIILPAPMVRVFSPNMKCYLCGESTDKLYCGSSSLCCAKCLKKEKEKNGDV